jgi:cytoskeletal protein CcmA (bactofilin family)
MLRKVRDDERGIAMVLALVVTFVVLLLSVFVVQMAIHNVDQSSYDRRRLLSVTAAEAGVKDYYAYLSGLLRGGEQNTLDTIHCSLQAGVATGPNEAVYDASIQFYNAAGATMSCPPPTGAVPTAVRITSTGQAPSGAARKMESYSQLLPIYGGTTAALLSNGITTLNNKLTLNGYNGSDADTYVNGNLVVSNNQTFAGNLYVQGTVNFSSSAIVDGAMWALNSITMSNGVVNDDVFSTNGSISINNPAVIYGDAKAKTTIADTARIQGTSSPNTSGLANPPSQSLPSLPYDLTKWTNAGYQLAQETEYSGANACTNAKSFLSSLPSVPIAGVNYNYVVRINATCDVGQAFSNNDVVNLPGNVAILTNGPITMSNHLTWQSVGGNHALYLVSVSSGSSCTGGTSKNITTSNLTEFKNIASPNRLDVFIYTSGTVSLSNLSAMNGQVYGCPVSVQNQTTLNYVPVFVPGLTTVIGFRQNVQYLREIPA